MKQLHFFPVVLIVVFVLAVAASFGQDAAGGYSLASPAQVLISDSFNRTDADGCSLGQADLAFGGSGVHYYLTIFASGARIASQALQNNGADYGGVQFTASPGACNNLAIRGENVGQDMNIKVDLLVPSDAANHVSQAGPYLRSRAAANGDGIIGGTSAGYWVQLWSNGEVRVKRLNPAADVAITGVPPTFDNTIFHTLEIAAQGNDLQVALDGELLTFTQDGSPVTTVSIPPTSGSNNGTAGIAFSAETNRGQIGGQRARNLIVGTYQRIPTRTPTSTATRTSTPEPTGTATASPTATASVTPTPGTSVTPTSTPTATASVSPTPTRMPRGLVGLQLVQGPHVCGYNRGEFCVDANFVTCGSDAVVQVTMDILGEAPVSIQFTDQLGRNLGSASWLEDWPSGLGATYRGTLVSSLIYGNPVPQIFDLRYVVTYADGKVFTESMARHTEVCVDPSGYIYDATSQARVPGAVVTLFYEDPVHGAVFWNASDYGQVNPQVTDLEGRYGWDTPPGGYHVTVSRPCFQDVTSYSVTVPPEVTDLNVAVVQTACFPVQVISADVLNGAGQRTERLPPGSAVRLEAVLRNTSEQPVATQVDLLVRGPDGEVIPSMSLSEQRVLAPGDNTITHDTSVPAHLIGEWSFVVQAGDGTQSDLRIRQISSLPLRIYMPMVIRQSVR